MGISVIQSFNSPEDNVSITIVPERRFHEVEAWFDCMCEIKLKGIFSDILSQLKACHGKGDIKAVVKRTELKGLS